MARYSWKWPALMVSGGIALSMLVAGRGAVLGVDIGMLGSALLCVTAWIALYAVSKMPGDALEGDIAPGEWQAWIGTVFMGVATVYFVSKLHLFQFETVPGAPHLRVVVRNLVMLLVAWLVLSRVIASRWKGRVQSDERDREIEARAAGWGRGALVAAVIALAVTLGLSPADRLAWATHFMIGSLLILMLMGGWLVENAATAALYWRDRRGVA